MISSMTGYGRGEAAEGGISACVEIRSVNNRYLEVSPRLPRSLALRENDVKEVLRRRISRGKLNVTVTVERETDAEIPLKVNPAAAKAVYKMLNDVRKAVKLRQTVRLEHLLQFSDIFEQHELDGDDEAEWAVARTALERSIDSMLAMRSNEGGELAKDFRARLDVLAKTLVRVEELSKEQVPRERERLRTRIQELMEGRAFDEGRLEQELTLLADRLDVTEECVRFRSHIKFFLEAIASPEPAGRKLNFLIQEMHRETNTIGSKSTDTTIAHLVVGMKEELEKLREQIQNIE
jgi:uncharacterized protein (TIGR00255 family)